MPFSSDLGKREREGISDSIAFFAARTVDHSRMNGGLPFMFVPGATLPPNPLVALMTEGKTDRDQYFESDATKLQSLDSAQRMNPLAKLLGANNTDNRSH